ncbi:MAG: AAA family ATPase [PVC group bacterium]
MYKIGIIGTFGVGKTTFIHRLFSELKYRAFQVEMVPELSRLCPYDINESGKVTRGQYWICKEQIRLELEAAELLPDFLLCDRCVFDNSIFAWRGAKEGYVDPAVYGIIGEAADYWQRTYFLLLYIELEDHLRLSCNRGIADGVRSTNEDFQLAIEELIKQRWPSFPGRKLKIRGSLSERINGTMEYLRREIGDARLSERVLSL